jgi:hypothetical protein
MLEYRTAAVGGATELLLGPEFETLESQLNLDNVEYNIPVAAPDTCAWCGELITPCRFPSGRWISAPIVYGPDGVPYANLAHEHCCEPAKRWERSLDVPEDAEEGESR